MRHPVQLWRELGLSGFLALQLIAGGSVLAALVHPFFLGSVLYQMLDGAFLAESHTPDAEVRKWLALVVLASGYIGSICLGLVGLKRRELLRIGWVLVTIPAYWLLLSAAAARAVYQLVRADHRWEKTPHGLGRSSLRRQQRSDASTVRATARHFTAAIAARNRRRH